MLAIGRRDGRRPVPARRLGRRRDHRRRGSNERDRQRSPAVSCHDLTPSPRPPERGRIPRAAASRSSPRRSYGERSFLARCICDTRRCNVLLPERDVLQRFTDRQTATTRPAQARRGRRGARRRRVPEHGVQRLQPARAALTRPARARAAHRGRARLRRARSRRPQPAQRRAGAIGVVFRRSLADAFDEPATVELLRGLSDVTDPRQLALVLVPGLPEVHPSIGPAVRQRRRRRPDRVLDGRRRSAVPGGAPAAAADRDRRLARRRRPGGDRQRTGDDRSGVRRDRRPGRGRDRRAPPARPRPSPPRRPELRPHRPLAPGPGRPPPPGGSRGKRAEGAPRGLGPRGRRPPGWSGRSVPVELVPVTSAEGCLAGARALLDRARRRHGRVRVQRPARARRPRGRTRARPVGARRPLDRRLRRHRTRRRGADHASTSRSATRAASPPSGCSARWVTNRRPPEASCCPRGSSSATRPLRRPTPRSRPRSAASTPRSRRG